MCLLSNGSREQPFISGFFSINYKAPAWTEEGRMEAQTYLLTAGRGWGCAAACTPGEAAGPWCRSWLRPLCTAGRAGSVPPAAAPVGDTAQTCTSGDVPIFGRPKEEHWAVTLNMGHTVRWVWMGEQMGQAVTPLTLPWPEAKPLSSGLGQPCLDRCPLSTCLHRCPDGDTHLMVGVDLAKILHAEVRWAGAPGSLLHDHRLGDT